MFGGHWNRSCHGWHSPFHDAVKPIAIIFKNILIITNAWRLKYPETARHEVDAMFAFLAVILKVNSNNTIKPYRVNLTRDIPPNIHEYEKILGLVPYFTQEANEMFFREKDLLIPMKAFNPETFQLLRPHIEAQLRKFNNEESICKKVKAILLSSMQYQFPDINAVASKLNISSRTLQRQLSREQTSFNKILLETRFDLAKKLLKQNNLTVSEIGYTLGYSDIGNFSRSFKRYVGIVPSEYGGE